MKVAIGMTELKTNPDYEALWGALPKTEYEALKASIENDGLLEKIIVNPLLEILDGHHRHRALQDLGIEVTQDHYEIQDHGGRDGEIIYILRTQINRRHATPFRRIENAMPLYKIYQEEAEKRRAARWMDSANLRYQWGKSSEALAEITGLKPRRVETALYIIKHGSEKDKIGLRRGATRIHAIHLKIRNALQREKPRPPLPEGVYDVIYADPPWSYTYKGTTRGVATGHYPTMELDEIVNLEVYGVPITDKIANDAVLFLWVTNPFLEKAFEVVNGWGFTYKTSMAWVKTHIGLGYYVRSQHENLYICLKGDVKAPAEADRHSSIIEAPNPKHSEKPEKVYGIIEKMYPNRKYLELFARGIPRSGWTFWGDETK